MGRTYASIHVIDSDIESVEQNLEYCQNGLPDHDERADKIISELQGQLVDVFKLLSVLKNVKEETITFYSWAKGNNVSVFSDHIQFETVESVAENYFWDVDNLVIAFGVLDSDVLKISFWVRGKLISSIVVGEDLDEYGIEKGHLNKRRIKKYLEQFGIDLTTLLQVTENGVDVDDIAHTLSEMFGLPLAWKVSDAKARAAHQVRFVV